MVVSQVYVHSKILLADDQVKLLFYVDVVVVVVLEVAHSSVCVDVCEYCRWL